MDPTTKVMIAGAVTTVLGPAVAAVLGALPALLRKRDGTWPAVAGGASVLAVATALWGVRGLPAGIPTDTVDWVPLVAVALGVALVALDLVQPRLQRAFGGVLVGTGVGAGGYLVLAPAMESQPTVGVALVVGVALTTLVHTAVTWRDLDADASAGRFAALAVSSGGAALVVAASGSALVGQMLGAAATGAVVLTALAWLRPALAPGRAAFGVYLTALTLLSGYAFAYSELSPFAAGAVLLAPLGALVASVPGAGWKRVAGALATASVAVGLALGVAALGQTAPQDAADDYGYPAAAENDTDTGADGYYTPY